ncbi:hypothetical protein [Thermincola ferriacetica]
MCDFYYDEENGVAYKVDPIRVSFTGERDNSGMIVVQTDVKVTNLRKEKIRRTLAEVYQAGEYNLETAKEKFINSRLKVFMGGARKIPESEYEEIKAKYEAM